MDIEYKKISTVTSTIDNQAESFDIYDIVKKDVGLNLSINQLNDNIKLSYKTPIELLVTVTNFDPSTNSTIQFMINDTILGNIKIDKNNTAKFKIQDTSKYTEGTYTVTATFTGNKYYNIINTNKKLNIVKLNRIITLDKNSTYPKENLLLKASVTDENENPVSGEILYYNLNNDGYYSTTVYNGTTNIILNIPEVKTPTNDELDTQANNVKGTNEDLPLELKMDSTTQYSEFYEKKLLTLNKLKTNIKSQNITGYYNNPITINGVAVDEHGRNIPFGKIKFYEKTSTEENLLGSTYISQDGILITTQINKNITNGDAYITDNIEVYPKELETTTTLTVPNNFTIKTNFTCKAVVTSSELPIGLINFIVEYDGKKDTIASVELNESNGEMSAEYTFAFAKTGEHKITAIYKPLFNFKTSSNTKTISD